MQLTLEIRRGVRIAMGTLGLAALGVVPFVAATPADAAKTNAQPIAVNITGDVVTATPDTISPGQVTFQVMNRTAKQQDFQIDGPGIDTELEDIAAGATRSVTMMLGAGTYKLQATDDNGKNERVSLLTVRP